jgi:signal transduction histidine kinase/PAS domain-containing protein
MEQTHLLEATLQSMTNALAIYDFQGTILRTNPLYNKLFGVPPGANLTEQPIEERQRLLQPCDAQGNPIPLERMPVARFLRGETLTSEQGMEYFITALDGREVALSVTGAPLPNGDGQIIGAVAVFRDVTERKRLERELAEQSALLEMAFGAITEGLVIYDCMGNVLRMNPAARQIIGVDDRPDALSLPLDQRISPFGVRDMSGQAMPKEQWPIIRILRGETIPASQAIELQVMNLDGREIINNLSGGPLLDQAGEIIGAVMITRDVTQQRRLAQRAQKALEALLQMAHLLAQPALHVKQAREALPSERTSTLLRHLATLACQVLGCARLNLVLVQPDTELLEPLVMVGVSPEQEQQWCLHMQGLALGEYLAPETIARLKAGEPVFIGAEQRRLPIQTPSLEVAQFLTVPLHAGKTLLGGMSLDYGDDHRVTADELALAQALGNLVALTLEREQLVLASREARAQVATLEHEKTERETFISLVVHELRTPLTIISAHTQMLGRSAGMDEARRTETIRKIREQTRRLQRLIDDLLDVSRIAAGTFELAPELTDLCALVRSVVEEQQATTQQHALRLEMSTTSVIGLWDRQRLSQVLSNLLSNAIKYSEGGEVRVTLQQRIEGMQMTVQDQGAGMTPEEIGQLFKLYSRLARTRQIAGNGLGLYLTQGILEAHGGSIWVSSPGPGQGCTYTYTLPLSAAQREPS